MMANFNRSYPIIIARSTAIIVTILLLGLLNISMAIAQQLPDNDFAFENTHPAFGSNSGPRVLVDEFHSPHVKRGSMDPFIKLINQDGFRVSKLKAKLTSEVLEKNDILVIANSYNLNFDQHSVLEPVSAYDEAEIDAILKWVSDGGKLLWLADHAPFAGGTVKLAERFGITFYNSWVVRDKSLPLIRGNIRYHKNYGMNGDHPIFTINQSDMTAGKLVEHVVLFSGQAFIAPADANLVFTIPDGFTAIFSNRPSREITTALRIPATGLSQGATMAIGKGRVALFGEAGAFSAQIINGQRKMGMNVPNANHNAQFVLNTMRWLAQ